MPGIQPVSPADVSRSGVRDPGAVNDASDAREKDKDRSDGCAADQQMSGVSHIQRGICSHGGGRCGKRIYSDAGRRKQHAVIFSKI